MLAIDFKSESQRHIFLQNSFQNATKGSKSLGNKVLHAHECQEKN